MSKNLAVSVRARLLNLAKAEASDFNAVLVRYALERLLYRLGVSAHADRFVLKGALLFTLWYDMPHRATRDADLLGYGPSDLESIGQAFRDIVSIEVADGAVFDPASVRVEEIRRDAGYGGARVAIVCEVSGARCRTQVDIGFGDAVTPEPILAVYPTLLRGFPAPTLKTYPVHTAMAEKLHAIVLLGMANTRLKDYLDLSVMLEREAPQADLLVSAIAATFKRRGTAVPHDVPVGLTDEFANDPTRQSLWLAVLRRNSLAQRPLPVVVAELRRALADAWQRASRAGRGA